MEFYSTVRAEPESVRHATQYMRRRQREQGMGANKDGSCSAYFRNIQDWKIVGTGDTKGQRVFNTSAEGTMTGLEIFNRMRGMEEERCRLNKATEKNNKN